jgi:hypothetical protein
LAQSQRLGQRRATSCVLASLYQSLAKVVQSKVPSARVLRLSGCNLCGKAYSLVNKAEALKNLNKAQLRTDASGVVLARDLRSNDLPQDHLCIGGQARAQKHEGGQAACPRGRRGLTRGWKLD